MTWATCLRSRPFKYGFFAGLLTFGAGAGGSAAIALKIASHCSSAIAYFISEMGKNITISELEAILHLGSYNVTLTLDDINAALPAGWLDIINTTTELPPYCFRAPFALGLCVTTVASLALASTIALAIHIHDHNEDRSAPPRELEGIIDNDEVQSLLRY